MKLGQNDGGQTQGDVFKCSRPYKTLTLDVTYFDNQE